MKNLWPESFKEPDIELPKGIFEQQAKLLPKLTGDFVYAEVLELSGLTAQYEGIRNTFVFAFYLKGSFLENYSYKILSFSHDIPIYPILMAINSEILNELGMKDARIEVESFEQLELLLQAILKSKRVSEVIGAIIKMSK